jgi:hypothetical protein
MGYNTTLIILNDSLHEIANDKNFGRKVAEAITTRERKDIHSGCHCNAATVIETHHADSVKLIAVGGNCGKDLGYVGDYRSTTEEMLRTLAESMGFRVSKKPTMTKRYAKNKGGASVKSTS